MTKIAQYNNLYFMIPLVLAILRDNYLKGLISIISLNQEIFMHNEDCEIQYDTKFED